MCHCVCMYSEHRLNVHIFCMVVLMTPFPTVYLYLLPHGNFATWGVIG